MGQIKNQGGVLSFFAGFWFGLDFLQHIGWSGVAEEAIFLRKLIMQASKSQDFKFSLLVWDLRKEPLYWASSAGELLGF